MDPLRPDLEVVEDLVLGAPRRFAGMVVVAKGLAIFFASPSEMLTPSWARGAVVFMGPVTEGRALEYMAPTRRSSKDGILLSRAFVPGKAFVVIADEVRSVSPGSTVVAEKGLTKGTNGWMAIVSATSELVS